jgi:serralysin
VTVQYATADGTATVADNDYIPNSALTVTFAPGETSKQVIIPVVGDSKVEGSETFFVNLTNASANASISDTQGQATVNNDDTANSTPLIKINNVAKKEGGSGVSTTFTFTVSLSNSSTKTVTVNYATASGTASSSSDYTSKTGTLTFTPGQTSKTISVTVKGDTSFEPDESFFVNLSSATNATIGDSQALATIQNDDSTSSTSVSVITDPTDSTKTALRIIGTNNSDTIDVINTTTSQGKSKVTINGSNKGTFSFTGGIFVYGQDGNDKITINSNITRPTMIFGGFGNDAITGGSGADVISGEAGNDVLLGGAGRDVLIGGDGKDSVDGQADDDVLLTGDVMSVPHISNLNSLRKEWTRTDISYSTRVGHLQNGGGSNSIKLNKSTCFSSLALADTATGGSGNDFFLAAVNGDVVTDKGASEILTNIGL